MSKNLADIITGSSQNGFCFHFFARARRLLPSSSAAEFATTSFSSLFKFRPPPRSLQTFARVFNSNKLAFLQRERADLNKCIYLFAPPSLQSLYIRAQ